MRIFLAYGFNDRDRWVRDLVVPLVEAFGDTPVDGSEVHGQTITDAVRRSIRDSDGLIAFVMQRPGEPPGVTSRWVTDELAVAVGSEGVRVLEVRETGLRQAGIADGRQVIEYHEGSRDACLVEIATTIGHWHRTSNVRMQILPQEVIGRLRPFLRHRDLACTYSTVVGARFSPEREAKLIPFKGGLFVVAEQVPADALVQVRIRTPEGTWISDFESLDAFTVQFREE